MIGIITKNNTVSETLKLLLKDFPAEQYTVSAETSSSSSKTYEAVLLAEPLPDELPDILPTIPLITLGGTTNKTESLHIDTPIAPDKLVRKIQLFLDQSRQLPSFENSFFLFEGRNRTLIDKQSGEIIPLTEKENALLCCLATASPEIVSRDQLLASAWNYHPDTETHTVESHIYTLRQKIGPKADSLIQNTSVGYTLITN